MTGIEKAIRNAIIEELEDPHLDLSNQVTEALDAIDLLDYIDLEGPISEALSEYCVVDKTEINVLVDEAVKRRLIELFMPIGNLFKHNESEEKN